MKSKRNTRESRMPLGTPSTPRTGTGVIRKPATPETPAPKHAKFDGEGKELWHFLVGVLKLGGCVEAIL